ncbi:MAG: TIGR02281 family clan AA aspartic protease [Rhodobacteraceae bacterium]|nr:TIGR02281 family clan AA aspartic protease [Paracoccaceae bacterium]
MQDVPLDNLLYLVVLCGALVTWLVVHNRDSLGTKIKQAAAWALIFIGAVAAAGLWDDMRRSVMRQATVMQEGRIEVPRALDGHYYLQLMMNGRAVDFVVDTGATGVVLTRSDAERAGLDLQSLSFFNEAMTANGLVRTAPVVLKEVQLGDVIDRNVRAQVNSGHMDMSLLGMSYLQRFDRLEIRDGRLMLQR